jgi:hypothetical protein
MQSRRQITYHCASPLYAGLPDPNPCLLGIIRDWAQTRGQDLPGPWEMIRPDEQFAEFCADAHQHAQHAPLEFRTLESYRALIGGYRCGAVKGSLTGTARKCERMSPPPLIRCSGQIVQAGNTGDTPTLPFRIWRALSGGRPASQSGLGRTNRPYRIEPSN